MIQDLCFIYYLFYDEEVKWLLLISFSEFYGNIEILSNNNTGNIVKTWLEMVDFLTALF